MLLSLSSFSRYSRCSSWYLCVKLDWDVVLHCVIEMRCVFGLAEGFDRGFAAACVHWLLRWAVVLVGGGFEQQLCICLSFCLLWAVLLLSSLGFWLRWWLALQTCFMWSCTMWTAGAWTWGGGSLWPRMADTSCVGIVSFWAPSCFNDLLFSIYLPHLNPLLSKLVTSCFFHKPTLFSSCPRHSHRNLHLRSITCSHPSRSESHSSGL